MKNQNLASAIWSTLSQVETEITQRNNYMNTRDRVIYEDGLYDGLDFPDGVDKTLYNYVSRVVDIHTSQLMGRGFQVYSSYNKEDTDEIKAPEAPEAPSEDPMAPPPPDPAKEQELVELQNKKLQRNADTRKRFIDGIIRDNGGMATFKHGARLGSSYGVTVYKYWLDKKAKKVNISLLETPQNYYPIWADSNFRERDADAYVYQISKAKAYRDYGKKLDENEVFATSPAGTPLGDNLTSDPINSKQPLHTDSTGEDDNTKNRMITVVDYTGIVQGFTTQGKEIVECKPGDEKPFSVLVVGGHVCQKITDPDSLPRYEVINNQQEPRRSAGKSDISESAIEINRTLVEVMSTWTTMFHKEIAPIYKAKGYEAATIPKRKKKMATFVPMSLEQDIEQLSSSMAFGGQSQQLIGELKDSFVRVTGIGRVMFDDPTINPTSNQALMTTLKGVIDIVEDKQSRWEPAILNMFTDALKLAGKLDPTIKEVVDEEGWFLYVKWPSVLRREDANYQQMWLNRFLNGTVSLGTYLEAMGTDDVTEEIDRIGDEMKTPVTAAILGKMLGELASQVITPPSPQGPDVKVSLRGDLTPYQEANLASQQGFNEGPFPPTAGPQGQGGLASQENADNVGFLTGNAFQGGLPIQQGPDGQPIQDQAQPQLTSDQNTGQTATTPGSGAPAVSPEGAIATQNQNRGS